MKQILADKDVQSRLLNAGAIAAYQPPAGMDKRIHGDFDKWGKVVRDKGIVAN